jgi:hypothetical protein
MAITIKKRPCPPPSVGATLMKTGQTTSYRTGDDGDIEAGRATDFFTLASNNPFGNTNRFTDELGGSTYTNNIVIDWSTYNGATVLGYYRLLDYLGNVTWDVAIDTILAATLGTFTGWRLTNYKELVNILDFSKTPRPYDYSPFLIGGAGNASFWVSTTRVDITTNAYLCGSVGNIGVAAKSEASGRGIPCRTFTVIGTTLT